MPLAISMPALLAVALLLAAVAPARGVALDAVRGAPGARQRSLLQQAPSPAVPLCGTSDSGFDFFTYRAFW